MAIGQRVLALAVLADVSGARLAVFGALGAIAGLGMAALAVLAEVLRTLNPVVWADALCGWSVLTAIDGVARVFRAWILVVAVELTAAHALARYALIHLGTQRPVVTGEAAKLQVLAGTIGIATVFGAGVAVREGRRS